MVWVRSIVIADHFDFQRNFPDGSDVTSFSGIASKDGNVILEQEELVFKEYYVDTSVNAQDVVQYEGPIDTKNLPIVTRQQRKLDADYLYFGAIQRSPTILIPYWSIAMPLTLFSAWCLLTNPRNKSVTKPEPSHA
jgi:hypothetical protein